MPWNWLWSGTILFFFEWNITLSTLTVIEWMDEQNCSFDLCGDEILQILKWIEEREFQSSLTHGNNSFEISPCRTAYTFLNTQILLVFFFGVSFSWTFWQDPSITKKRKMTTILKCIQKKIDEMDSNILIVHVCCIRPAISALKYLFAVYVGFLFFKFINKSMRWRPCFPYFRLKAL